MKTLGLVVAIVGVLMLGVSVYVWVAGNQSFFGGVIGSLLLVTAGVFCLSRAGKSAGP